MDAFWSGALAALAASACFAVGPTMFTLAGRQVGPVITLRWRLLLATLLLSGLHWLGFGRPWPGLTATQTLLLLASGAVGLAAADSFLFPAFVRLGPRLAMLILNLQPVLATLLARVWLGERLRVGQWAAMLAVLWGVSLVVLERGTDADGQPLRWDRGGVALTLAAAALGAVGVLLAKAGMQGRVPAVSANLVRMSGGLLPIWAWALARGQVRPTWQRVRRQPRVLLYLLLGASAGPVLGMSLSLYALRTIPVGIATTLTSLPPVLLLPVGHWVFGERITVKAVVGTLIATAGVAWLLAGG